VTGGNYPPKIIPGQHRSNEGEKKEDQYWLTSVRKPKGSETLQVGLDSPVSYTGGESCLIDLGASVVIGTVEVYRRMLYKARHIRERVVSECKSDLTDTGYIDGRAEMSANPLRSQAYH
jgi:hypothetical protein